jgi:putative ABC transport system ATP-binding protein
MNEKIVKISNLNFSFGEGSLKKQILFDVNLEIEKGEVVLMTGPSGSGKTTLLTLIGALRSPQEGSLQVLDAELSGADEKKMVLIRRNIGYIFQAHNLLKSLTARQNVMMSLELHSGFSPKEASERAAEMLQAVDLTEHIDKIPDQLSGGQKQRVAIARALAANPKLVLADEPTAALDSKSGRIIVEILQRLAREQGCSILLVTHDNRILDIADRIVNMEDGRLADNEKLIESVKKKFSSEFA